MKFPPAFSRVLKYERFDPPLASPPSSSLSSAAAAAPESPEALTEPKPLDLDLMTDLKDVIFSSAPPVNRHVSQSPVFMFVRGANTASQMCAVHWSRSKVFCKMQLIKAGIALHWP